MIETKYSYSRYKNMDGFSVNINGDELVVGSGALKVGDFSQEFRETKFELNKTGHILYDLYIVKKQDGSYDYYFDQTDLTNVAEIPSYRGLDELFHTFLSIEQKDGNFSGYVAYLKYGQAQLSAERMTNYEDDGYAAAKAD